MDIINSLKYRLKKRTPNKTYWSDPCPLDMNPDTYLTKGIVFDSVGTQIIKFNDMAYISEAATVSPLLIEALEACKSALEYYASPKTFRAEGNRITNNFVTYDAGKKAQIILDNYFTPEHGGPND